MSLINRDITTEIIRLNLIFPVITITGPRQSGKTTLCKAVFPNYKYINLEDIQIREMLSNSPKSILKEYSEGLIIDEAHYLPELFSYIQVLVDEDRKRRFVITSSSNLLLLEKVTQSLSGRTAILNLLPLSINELMDKKESKTDTLILKGGYPAVWNSDINPQDVYRSYYNTYIERDIRSIIQIKNLSQFQRFIKLCAGRIGTEFNASTFANELGVTVNTIQEWVSKLEASFVVFRLQPYYKNNGKRLIKSSKIYFYDTGLVCFLLGIENELHLKAHPLRGNLFENLVVVEFLKKRFNAGKGSNIYFYRDNMQKEVDVIQENGASIFAFEIKSSRDFNKDFLKGLNYIKKLFPDAVKISAVIYDGETEMKITDNGLFNFRNLDEILL